MKVKYFSDTDTLHIELRADEIEDARDLDADGRLCAITIEHASHRSLFPRFPTNRSPAVLLVHRRGVSVTTRQTEKSSMYRSIKTLRRADAPASDEEVRAAALQFVRTSSGYRQTSRASAPVFDHVVDEVARVLLDSLRTRGEG